MPGLIEILENFFFLNVVNYIDEFLLICCYLPLKKGLAQLLYKLESIQPRLLNAKFGWNLLGGSKEKDETMKSLPTERQTNSVKENCFLAQFPYKQDRLKASDIDSFMEKKTWTRDAQGRIRLECFTWLTKVTQIHTHVPIKNIQSSENIHFIRSNVITVLTSWCVNYFLCNYTSTLIGFFFK